MCAAVSGSTWDTWLNTRMHPPVAGIFSPSTQVCLVVASRTGFTTGTATSNAQPRFCCSLRTGRTLTCVPPVLALAPAPAPGLAPALALLLARRSRGHVVVSTSGKGYSVSRADPRRYDVGD